MKKKIIVSLVALLLVFQCSFSVGATSAYKSYVYDSNGEYYSAPDAFAYDKTVDFKSLKDNKGKKIGMVTPYDVYVSYDNKVYVTGTDEDGIGMIIVLNSDYSFNSVIKSFKHTITTKKGTKKTINDTFGTTTSTFVDSKDGSIYICDQNGANYTNTDYEMRKRVVEGTTGRLIKLDKNLNTEMCVFGIRNDVLPKNFNFQPTKVVVDAAGRIFVLSYSFNMGIMELDDQGEFVQCLGAPAVTYNLAELIWRKFQTDAQNERTSSFVPTEYSGIDIDGDGFIYVTNSTFTKETAESTACLEKLNAKGNDVLRTSGTLTPYGDIDASWRASTQGPSKLCDVITLDYDMYAVLDSIRGKVFFYNTDGINLFEFGTIVDTPDKDHNNYMDGSLNVPVSIEWLNNECIVLDQELDCIKTYSMTDYAKKIFSAVELHYNDKYDEEIGIWEDVLKLNNNSVAAKQSIGKVYYRNQDYITAMKYFKDIKDQENYSKAYKYQRQIYIEKYFTVAVIILVVLIILIKLFKKWRKKHKKEAKPGSYLAHLRFAKVVLGRPLYGNWILCRENNSSVLSATTILFAAALMSLLQSRYTGFIFDAEAERVNILIEFAKICIPVLLFSVCNWCVTSLLNGEGNFRAIYTSVCYSLTPIIILYPIAILFSNVMVAEEGDFYTVFVSLALVWVVLWIFFGNMRIHDYNLGMAVIEILVTLVVMLLIVFLAILFFALIQQMYQFVAGLFEEIATR